MKIVFAALLAAAGLCLLAAYICYRMAFYSPKGKQNDLYNFPADEQYRKHYQRMRSGVETLAHKPCETVSITSFDGLHLQARYYHSKDDAPLAICCHGYRATGIRDFSGGAVYLLEQGMNVLLIDQRAQGDSSGHTICFGVKERFDCLDWIRYAVERFGDRVEILLYGVSMGAATVLMASGLSLPDNVKGIVADSPYTSPKAIICKVCGDLKLSARLLYPFVSAGARLFGHLDLHSADAVEAVRDTRVPILIIHGEDDRFVPCDMSDTIYRANPAMIRRYTFPDAGHGLSYLEDTPRYIRCVSDFTAACLDMGRNK